VDPFPVKYPLSFDELDFPCTGKQTP